VFDTWNRLQSLTYPDGEVLTNQYDSGGSIRAAAGDKAGHHYVYLKRLEYDKFGQRTFVDLGNNVRTSYSYNPLNRRLANLKAGKGDGNLFQNLTYEYDKVGNILGQANSAAVSSPNQLGGATQYHYDYDDLYRLTHAEGTFDYQPDKQHSYQLDMVYDSIHNIKAKTQLHTLRQPSGQLITQKKTTYDWAYAYAGDQPHAPTHIGERTFSYDANGNQTGWEHDKNGTRRTIVWDAENRIQSIYDNGHEKTYKYDAAGERVIKSGPQGETVYVNQFFSMRNRSVGTKHVYAGKARLVSKLVKQENPTIRGQQKSKGKVGKGQAKSPSEAKWQYFYHPDHLGSSAYVTVFNGSLYQHLEYFAFGETFVEQSSNTQRTPYEFTAKELDEETGLYYFGARYYDARTSVWQNPDPILADYLPNVSDMRQAQKEGKRYSPEKNLAGMGGVFNTVNLDLYHYAGHNPVRYTDPDGRFILETFVAGAILNFLQQTFIPSVGKSMEKVFEGDLDITKSWDTFKNFGKALVKEFDNLVSDVKNLVSDKKLNVTKNFKNIEWGDVVIAGWTKSASKVASKVINLNPLEEFVAEKALNKGVNAAKKK
jgi:RHS repeat-associated protein